MEKIDFVITWVDGNDPAWIMEKEKYSESCDKEGIHASRFRDWGLLQYWFRGVEKFAPWVNRIYFITWGHVPTWLNTKHPKLKIINHRDYIPSEYLPTFNSNVIELFLYRIPELNNEFVLFNDDMYLIRETSYEEFFHNGMPRETPILHALNGFLNANDYYHTLLNNISVINSKYEKRIVQKKYWYKLFDIRYGIKNLNTFLLWPFGYFSSFDDLHLPTSHCKDTFNSVWNYAESQLYNCANQKFRSKEDVSHWLMKWWNICEGNFAPRSIKWGKAYTLGKDEDVYDAIAKQKYRCICVNDSSDILDFDSVQKRLVEAFELILPDKSDFEI